MLNNKSAKRRRVAITGMGAVTPLGHSLNDTWNGVMEGISVAAKVSRFDASQYPCQMAYEVRDFKLRDHLVTAHEAAYLNDAARFGVQAADEAIQAANLAASKLDPMRTAVCLGVGLGSPDVTWYDQVYAPKKFTDPSLKQHGRFLPDQLSSVLARQIGAKAGVTTVHTACASSGQALGEAYEMVAYGDADMVLTGGADSMINPFYLAGFSLLGALSKRNQEPRTASRPFDSGRDGFVFGEGAAMLVFEDWAHAEARGAVILGEVCGYGVTESAYRITDLHPEGHGPLEAMQMALGDAGIGPAEVGYINAHGTSTQLNDRIEALAISKVFGVRSRSTKVSSTKSMTGHMIAAAGAVEFTLCVKALQHQVLPPSINLFAPDPDCPIELTSAEPKSAPFTHALSASVGFGGSNTALIARRVRA